jgi:hypothetical protein
MEPYIRGKDAIVADDGVAGQEGGGDTQGGAARHNVFARIRMPDELHPACVEILHRYNKISFRSGFH